MSDKYTTQVQATIPTEQVQKIDELVYDNKYSSRAQFIKEAINKNINGYVCVTDQMQAFVMLTALGDYVNSEIASRDGIKLMLPVIFELEEKLGIVEHERLLMKYEWKELLE